MFAVESEHWQRHLTFRDALREREELRDVYQSLKLALAERHRNDREAYTNGKSAFIQRYSRD